MGGEAGHAGGGEGERSLARVQLPRARLCLLAGTLFELCLFVAPKINISSLQKCDLFLFFVFFCLLYGEGELYRCVKSTVSFDFDLDLVLFCALQHVFSSLLVKLRISEWRKEEKNIRSTVMVY